jgi:hypothetical protein
MLQQNGISYLFFDANFMLMQVSTSFSFEVSITKSAEKSKNSEIQSVYGRIFFDDPCIYFFERTVE